jgi:hypothetical protein
MTGAGAQRRSAREKTMSRSPRSFIIRRARNTDAGSSRRWNQRLSVAAVLLAAALVMASCSSGTDPNLQTAPTKSKPLTTSTTANPKLAPSTAGIQQKVLNAWMSAEEQLYAYADEPPAPLRADLVAGQTTSDLFPRLAAYFVNPALQSEGVFLLKLKMQLLNGPTNYDLGHPTVTALAASTATVAFCTSDTGTTTAAGKDGPLNLDGNDPSVGGVRGTSDLVLVDDAWKIASGQSTGVGKC